MILCSKFVPADVHVCYHITMLFSHFQWCQSSPSVWMHHNFSVLILVTFVLFIISHQYNHCYKYHDKHIAKFGHLAEYLLG
jgi:hypothetical protein